MRISYALIAQPAGWRMALRDDPSGNYIIKHLVARPLRTAILQATGIRLTDGILLAADLDVACGLRGCCGGRLALFRAIAGMCARSAVKPGGRLCEYGCVSTAARRSLSATVSAESGPAGRSRIAASTTCVLVTLS